MLQPTYYTFPITREAASLSLGMWLERGYFVFRSLGKTILFCHAAEDGTVDWRSRHLLNRVDAIVCCHPKAARQWLKEAGCNTPVLGDWEGTTAVYFPRPYDIADEPFLLAEEERE